MNFQEMFGTAKFVIAEETSVNPQMRGTFILDETSGKTEIVICGLGHFDLAINGKPVTDALFLPAASHYHHYDSCYCYEQFGEEMSCRIYCVKYDISDLVVKGENVIAIELGIGWYTALHKERDNMHYGPVKLCYKISQGTNTIGSNGSIRWREGCILASNFTLGESQDYTKADYEDGWKNIGYDDSKWNQAKEVEAPDSNYLIQDCPEDRIIRSVYPRLVAVNDTYKLYELGECISGWPILRCTDANAEVTVRMGEKITDLKLDDRWTHRQYFKVVTDGCDREYHPKFTYQAFSCIEVSANAELVRCDVIHTDIKQSSEFFCDNEVINWFHEAYVRTQLINIHNAIPTDCPHLEKRGYTGDGQLTCETVMTVFDAKRMYQKWMEDIADCQDIKTGHIQYTAPYVRSGGGPGGWGCAIVEIPYVYYKVYGDEEPLKKYFANMLRYFDYLEEHSEKDLVTSEQPGQWCLGDWCCPGAHHRVLPQIPEPFVNTYFYIKSLNRMIEIAKIIGKEAYIEQFRRIKEQKEKAVTEAYYDANTGDFAENKNCANAFAIDLGLGDDRTLQHLVTNMMKRGTFNTGIFGTDILVRVLFEHGFGELAVSLISTEKIPSFSYMMRNGATTLWEDWLGPRSMCHPMFGSIVKYFYYYLLGVRQREHTKGYEDIVIDPFYSEQVRRVSGKVGSPYGDIVVDIDRKYKYTITITIPQGVKVAFVDEYGETRKLSAGTSTFALSKEPELYERNSFPGISFLRDDAEKRLY